MSSSAASGLAAGFEMAQERAAQDAGAPVQQLGLFGAVIEDADGPPEARREPGKGGRPPGARNKRSEDWCRFILSRFKSPLVVLAEIAAADLHAICAEMGCDPLEALRIKMHAASTLAPYLHERRPQALELPDGSGLTVVIQTGAAAAQADVIDAQPLGESEQNQ